MVKTDAPIGYGASGGGIFSLETGKLLAIVEGYRTAKVGFAVAEQGLQLRRADARRDVRRAHREGAQVPPAEGLRPAARAQPGAPTPDGSQTASR